MCQHHEENPTVKQTEIGAMFGVERRSKGKFPDIERALSNWARNYQKQGLPLSDAITREKARFFAQTVGNSESHLKANNTSWLEKFKQKNHLMERESVKGLDRERVGEDFQSAIKCAYAGCHLAYLTWRGYRPQPRP
ncbi:hypothetical protein AA0116_g12819 [Alternaria tenuissima]|nr:hypothetical protein AA0116_g12819 [Alternaria tenuissima]